MCLGSVHGVSSRLSALPPGKAAWPVHAGGPSVQGPCNAAGSMRGFARTRETPQACGAHGEHDSEVPSAIGVQEDEDGRSPAQG